MHSQAWLCLLQSLTVSLWIAPDVHCTKFGATTDGGNDLSGGLYTPILVGKK